MTHRRGHLRAIALSSLLMLVVVVAQVGGLHARYTQSVDAARERMQRSGILLSEWIHAVVAINDLVLRDVVDDVGPADLAAPLVDSEAYAAHLARLHAKLASIDGSKALGLFNAQCTMTHATDRFGLNARGHSYCQDHLADPSLETSISGVVTTASGERMVVQTRAIRDDEGAFIGFAAIGMELEAFDKVLTNVTVPDGAVHAVQDTTFTIVARTPHDPAVIGRRLEPDATLAQALTTHGWIHAFHDSPIDGVRRLLVFQRMDDLPFIILSGESREVYLAGFRGALTSAVATTGLLTLLALVALRAHHVVLRQRDLLHAMAHHDPLTHVANRRALEEVASSELARMHRSGRPLSLLELDVDRFKDVNDQHGHGVGDDVLRAVARGLREHVREVDTVARLGGDEFAVLLPETPTDRAYEVRDRIVEELNGLQVACSDGSSVHIHVSVGVATVTPLDDADLGTLLRRADQAMYAAKIRNRSPGHPVRTAPS